MITIENLHKSFNGIEVLKGVSLEVEDGEVMALIGPSGDGKSVLLKHVAGLMRPDTGRIAINGKDLGLVGRSELADLRSHLGFLFQNGALFDSMTVYDNVAFPLREKTRLAEGEIGRRVLDALSHVGLEGAGQKAPAELSGGMAKRAALARAMVLSPSIMLLDEPTTGLDPIIVHAIHDLIVAAHQRLGFSGLLVSHEIPGVFAIVQRVALLHEGTIQFVGTPQEVLDADDPVVKGFIQGSLRAQPWMGTEPGSAGTRPQDKTGVRYEREAQSRTDRGAFHDRRDPLPSHPVD
jgi:phospholipid/cholesterol/gamma-HCH transport system ATP-binding protein